MIARSKSFSKGGNIIDRVMEIEKYRVKPQKLQQMLKPRIKSRPPEQPREPANGFDLVTGRDKPNSFLTFNIRDTHTHLDYQNKKDTVLARSGQLPIRKETDERLSLLMRPQKQFKQEQSIRLERQAKSCRKFRPSEGQQVVKAVDLQNARKTFHNIDFQKQTDRPFDQTISKMALQTNKGLTRYNSTGTLCFDRAGDPLDKKDKIHSFASYSQRQFLSEKKVRGMPQTSGQDWYKVNPQKFKSHWKTVAPPKFEEMAKKKLSRYDRDCPHWFTQLAYNVKEKEAQGSLDFEKHTGRKENIVKSGYPIRLAI